MQVNSNSGSQILELWSTRRQSIQNMVKDVQSGDTAGAQQALIQLQQTDQSLGINEGSSDDSSSGTSSRPGRPHMDLSNLVSAVQSGDLSAAQNAWQQVQANMSNSPYGGNESPGSNLRGMAKDLTSLLNAVNSGDSDSMQSAATAVAQDLRAFTSQTTDATQQAASATDTSTSTDPSKTLIGDLQNLISAAQSGDTSSAQSAEQKLQQDLQTAMSDGPKHAGHHHHHHGGGAPAVSAATSSASTLTTSDPAAANTSDPASTDSDAANILTG